MKRNLRDRIASHTSIWAIIVFVTSMLLYLLQNVRMTYSLLVVRKIVYLIFPHEILMPVKYLFLPLFRSPQLSILPVFSILFSIFLFIAIQYFKNQHKTVPLYTACYIFLGSMLLSIPNSITDYNTALKAYNNYHPSNQMGILGLIDGFSMVHKPSLGMLISQLVILLFYMVWVVYVLKWMNALKREEK